MTAPSSTPTGEVDGRRARRERGRAAVIDAMFELMDEGHLPPSVDVIAERSGVSVSSLFRYFESLDDLERETIERHFDRISPLFEIPSVGEGPLERRIATFVDSRLGLYEVISGTARMARIRAGAQPAIATALRRVRGMWLDQVRRQFAPELATLTPSRADDLTALIDSLTSFESWDLLRDAHGRSPSQIRRAWTRGLELLCGPIAGGHTST